jgi:hypothetical protein
MPIFRRDPSLITMSQPAFTHLDHETGHHYQVIFTTGV